MNSVDAAGLAAVRCIAKFSCMRKKKFLILTMYLMNLLITWSVIFSKRCADISDRGIILQKNSDLFEKNCKKTFLAACFAV
jgi:hypothetical protein